MSEHKKPSMSSGPKFGGGPAQGLSVPGEKPKEFKKTAKKLLSYLKPHWTKFSIVLICCVLGVVFTIVSPKVLGLITTNLFDGVVSGAGVNFGYITNLILWLLGLYILSSVFTYFQHFIMSSVSQKVVYDMRKDLDEKMARLPIKFFDSKTHGEIMSRVTNDVETVSTSLQQSLLQILSAVTTIVGILVMMLTISWQMTLITLVTLPVSMAFTIFIAKKSQKYFIGQQKVLGDLSGHVEEMYAGDTIVKAFGYTKRSTKKFDKQNDELYTYAWKSQFVSGVIMPGLMFVGNVGYVAISVVGGLLASGKMLSVGDIQAFIQYSKQFMQPITQTANIASILQSTIASAERVFEFLEEDEEEQVPAKEQTIKAPNGNVVFDHVGFSYSKDAPLIRDLSLKAKAGDTIAIVGPTGAGKTTLVNLLMRFYEIDNGDITIDGVSIKNMTRQHIHNMFGMVLQDTWLFNGSIYDNIAYGKAGATKEQVENAADMAFADHFIRSLPKGYNTIINEEGTNISQGQKQLLTIARAILSDPTILILDEATSSVDTRTELLIQKGMESLMQGRTSFVIAHRLSTIKDASCILVMDHGDIIEQGTHDQLIAQNGFYEKLYNSQFSEEAE